MGVQSDVQAKFISDEIAADPDGISASASVGNNAAFVIGGALHSGGTVTLGGSARKVVLVSAGDDSSISFTVVGTDINGTALTETVSGVDSDTATSTKYFKTITGITAVGNPAGAMEAGTATAAADVVHAGRVRLKGYSIVSGGTAGAIEFFNGDPNDGGSALFKARTIGTDNTTIDNTIPDEGVVFKNGLYVVYTIGTIDMMTFFFA